MICENASLHMVACIFSYMGDLQLRDFISFMINQIEWHLAVKLDDTNEGKASLWIRVELGMDTEFRGDFKLFLSILDI